MKKITKNTCWISSCWLDKVSVHSFNLIILTPGTLSALRTFNTRSLSFYFVQELLMIYCIYSNKCPHSNKHSLILRTHKLLIYLHFVWKKNKTKQKTALGLMNCSAPGVFTAIFVWVRTKPLMAFLLTTLCSCQSWRVNEPINTSHWGSTSKVYQ